MQIKIFRSQLIVLILLGIYILLGTINIFALGVNGDSINKHGMFSLLATMVLGAALLVFRLLRGLKTTIPQYTHLVMVVISLVLYVVGLFLADRSQWIAFNTIHVLPGYVSLACFMLQLISSCVLMTKMYSRKSIRQFFSPFHDLIGLWIYICLVGCCIAGNKALDGAFPFNNVNATRRSVGEILFFGDQAPTTNASVEISNGTMILPIAPASYTYSSMIFCIMIYLEFAIVVGITLSPYFEWELIMVQAKPKK